MMTLSSDLVIKFLVHCILFSYMHQTVDCIVGGRLSKQDWPWLVSFGRRTPDSWRHHCGGALISSRWVLTAAHCMYEDVDDQIEDFTVIAGSIDLNTMIKSSVEKKIKNIIVHEHYERPPSYDNDIALIELAEDVTFTSLVGPVTLAHELPPVNTMCVAAGWGVTKTEEDVLLLKEVDVSIVDINLCEELTLNHVTSNMMCAGEFEGGKDACQGDSGGPLVCKVDGKYIQVGVTSWGEDCALDASPGIYADVPVLRDWITTNTGLSL